jgi:hypothetical protein
VRIGTFSPINSSILSRIRDLPEIRSRHPLLRSRTKEVAYPKNLIACHAPRLIFGMRFCILHGFLANPD